MDPRNPKPAESGDADDRSDARVDRPRIIFGDGPNGGRVLIDGVEAKGGPWSLDFEEIFRRTE